MTWKIELLAQSAFTADLFHDLICQEQRPVDLYQLSCQWPLLLRADTEYWLVGLLGYWWGKDEVSTHVHTQRMTGWADEEHWLLCLLRAVWRLCMFGYPWLGEQGHDLKYCHWLTTKGRQTAHIVNWNLNTLSKIKSTI